MSVTKNAKQTRKTSTKAAEAKPDAGKAEVVAKKPKAAKPDAAKKPKRLSAIDATAQVLKEARKPMRAQELITAMAEKGLWTSPGGKMPSATLSAAMLTEVAAKGKDARLTKADRGQFAFNG